MTDDELKAEYQRLNKLSWDRELIIAKGAKDRHKNIDFSNPLFDKRLNELKQEIENRGLSHD